MLNEVKTSLRITSDVLNDDIKSNINAALLDMSRVGVNISAVEIDNPKTYDALILTCVELYCKWIFDYIQKGEQWHIAYERLRDSMSRCKQYNE